jgi:hypothetical protein
MNIMLDTPLFGAYLIYIRFRKCDLFSSSGAREGRVLFSWTS